MWAIVVEKFIVTVISLYLMPRELKLTIVIHDDAADLYYCRVHNLLKLRFIHSSPREHYQLNTAVLRSTTARTLLIHRRRGTIHTAECTSISAGIISAP